MDSLRRKCEEHLVALTTISPSFPHSAIVRSQDPTSQDLFLPSQFTKSQRQAYGLDEIEALEGSLRVGNAHDHLNALRDALGLRGLLVQAKKTHIRGHVQNTRSEASIRRAAQLVKRHQQGYRRNWGAIVRLDVGMGPGSPAAGLQELRDSDVKNLKDIIDSSRPGARSDGLPWIWRSMGNLVRPGASAMEVQRAIDNWEQEGGKSFATLNHRFCDSPTFPVSSAVYLGSYKSCSRSLVGRAGSSL